MVIWERKILGEASPPWPLHSTKLRGARCHGHSFYWLDLAECRERGGRGDSDGALERERMKRDASQGKGGGAPLHRVELEDGGRWRRRDGGGVAATQYERGVAAVQWRTGRASAVAG
ncbi:hypothetical protein OsJ_23452 [Oryza sativa Japonica Group]|uniref:Uncharacterized protein n=1 Tax=Oryza sativa subsp. japonica TaxID=39947 RepID=B9FW11_ORYSJ|nr:hypothetical protein OsJ_23452 [Oryza sativa Japonica Group]